MLLILVRAVDKMEQSANNIVHTCHILQENIRKSYVSDEMVVFVKFLKVFSPKISVSGLFEIDRSIFAKIFRVLTSYAVIILGFRKI